MRVEKGRGKARLRQAEKNQARKKKGGRRRGRLPEENVEGTGHGPIESSHGVKGMGLKKTAERVPEFEFGAQVVPQKAKQRPGGLEKLIGGKGEKHQEGEVGGEVADAVAVIVFKVVALVFERVEGFIFNLPACPTGAHDFLL